MELYVLDSQLRRVAVIDRFESFIWTDRFIPTGDFQLVLHSTPELRALLTEGTRVATNESTAVMEIETVLDDDTSEGRSVLTVSGRSLELVFHDRVARTNLSGLDASPRWALTGTPGNVVRQIFKNICVDGMVTPNDILPFITEGNIFPSDTIDEPTEIISLELEPDTLYNAFVNICDTYSLGFALARNQDLSQLHFIVYAGSDRTSLQTDLSPAIFSPELESLTNSTELVSTENYKNVAYVYSPTMSVIVYADGTPSSVKGFERKVLMLKVDDVKPNDSETGLSTKQILVKRGKDELLKYKRISAFDGEIPKSGYKYGVDYRLGDIVEMQKDNGATVKYMRVTEQIFVSDAEGDRSYPTLSDILT